MWPLGPEPSAITYRHHLAGRDIGTGAAAARNFVKPPDRRCEDAVVDASEASSLRLLRRFRVSLTFHWTRAKLARVAHHGPDEVWRADRRTCPAKPIEHTARELSAFEPEAMAATQIVGRYALSIDETSITCVGCSGMDSPFPEHPHKTWNAIQSPSHVRSTQRYECGLATAP
jgi:hypothetical protein